MSEIKEHEMLKFNMGRIPLSPLDTSKALIGAELEDKWHVSETELRQAEVAQISVLMSSQISFVPATYVTGKVSYVTYYVVDPITNQKVRKRHRLDHIKNPAERKRYAKKMVHDINLKLYAGWNPLVERSSERIYTTMDKCIDRFLVEKNRELRKDSNRSYKSFIKYLQIHLTSMEQMKMAVGAYNETDAISLMEHISGRDISQTTYNNYLRFYKTLWNWFKDHKYVSFNPFNEIRPKRKSEKKRKLIPQEVRDQIAFYLIHPDRSDTGKNFLLFLKMIFFTLMRPKELLNLKFEDINIQKNTITIQSAVSKNKKTQSVTIPDAIMEDLLALKSNFPSHYYIFGSSTLKPGTEVQDGRRVSKMWSKMRNDLKFSDEYQMYSLKDTGITELIKMTDSQTAMNQARHSDLTTTTKYLHRDDSGIIEIVNTPIAFSRSTVHK